MKNKLKLTTIAVVGLALTSSLAYSDLFGYTCQWCNQIAMPNPACKAKVPTKTFCGAEGWMHDGNQDCKRFFTYVRTCYAGGTQTWTAEEWAGAGSNCTPMGYGTSHDCY